MKVGYLGPGKSTFGYMAAEKFFARKNAVEFIPLPNHREICQKTGEGEVHFGVVAAENVIEGIVTETVYCIDRMCRSDHLLIVGEVELPIELFLLCKDNKNRKKTFSRIISHQVAARQCSKRLTTFRAEHNNIPVDLVDSNSRAAEIASKDVSCVAVSTGKAEIEYGLTKVEPNSITNNGNNFTRFWVIGNEKPERTGNDKICLVINFDQSVPGGVSSALAAFAKRRINLLMLAPIPIPGRKWEYSFLVEFAGSFRDQPLREAYQELCESGVSMDAPIILGSYPAATTK